MKIVKKWDFAEFTFFLENEQEPDFTTPLKAVFTGEKETLEVEGFYDGAGRCTGESIYKIRFMPSYEGHYTYKVEPGNHQLGEDSDSWEGEFEVTAPARCV